MMYRRPMLWMLAVALLTVAGPTRGLAQSESAGEQTEPAPDLSVQTEPLPQPADSSLILPQPYTESAEVYATRLRHRRKTRTALAFRGVGLTTWLTAAGLVTTLAIKANGMGGQSLDPNSHDGTRYERIQAAVGPLVGGSIVFSVPGSVWNLASTHRLMPRKLVIPVLVTGAALLVTGIVMWARTPPALGDDGLDRPHREAGKLLLGAGLPLLTWGAGDALLWSIARSMH